MDCLIHHGAAAVKRLRSLPTALVVIGLRSPPFARRFRQREPAELSSIHRGLEGQVGVAETRREDGAELYTVAVASLDNAVAALGRDFQRLLNDHVLSRIGGGNGRFQVGAARRRDNDGLYVRPGQRGGEVRCDGAIKIEVHRHLAGVVGVAADQGGDVGAGNFGNRAGVEARDHAATDNAEAQILVP